MRCTLTLRLIKDPVQGNVFDFGNATEQVQYGQDWLIIDVEPGAADDGSLSAYAARGSWFPARA